MDGRDITTVSSVLLNLLIDASALFRPSRRHMAPDPSAVARLFIIQIAPPSLTGPYHRPSPRAAERPFVNQARLRMESGDWCSDVAKGWGGANRRGVDIDIYIGIIDILM